jgi:metal-sulfur cluster biosynthetic enzyme
VYDPELDEPITSLRFVSSCDVSADGDVEVHLRLPTPQCAPNFAFLMAADARRAVRLVNGVRSVSVVLDDHYTGEEINEALAAGGGFTGAFPGETDDDSLGSLRELFQRKALIARQASVCEQLLAAGLDAGAVTALRVRDVERSEEWDRCLELRASLGLSCSEGAPAFVTADGHQLGPAELQRWLRIARLIRTSLEANGGICRSLLQFRHGLAATEPCEEVTP